MSKIGVIANPHSKSFTEDSAQISNIIEKYSELGDLRVSHSIEEVSSILEHFKTNNIDILAIYGGDGTICQTLTKLIATYNNQPLPKIFILGGGTVNLVKTNLTPSSKPHEELEALFKGVLRQRNQGLQLQTKQINLLKVDNHFGFLFSDGCSCTFLQRYYQNKSNIIGVILLVLKYILSWVTFGKMYQEDFQQEKARVSFLDHLNERHKTLEYNSSLNLISTLERMPYRFRFFTEAIKQPAKLLLLNFSIRPIFIPLLLPFILIFKRNNIPVFSTKIQAKKFKIKYPSPKRISIDGELIDLKSNEVSIEFGFSISCVTL